VLGFSPFSENHFHMILHSTAKHKERGNAGFTLVEILVSLAVFGLVTGGLISGYVQVNRLSEWSSMSLAAQAYASQGLEQAKSAKWNYAGSNTNYGPGTDDELGYPASVGYTNYSTLGTMDIPATGDPITVTNYITITNVFSNDLPPLRQIRSDCVWMFRLTGQVCTNTVLSLRVPDS
jgi:prepilin-type N-terminal cleavage/methylation domain-containing protein